MCGASAVIMAAPLGFRTDVKPRCKTSTLSGRARRGSVAGGVAAAAAAWW